MRSELELFARRLSDEEYYDEEEGLSLFHGGGQCSICTDSAFRFVQAFGGMVVGYYASENPAAAVGRTLVDGHDFALIGGRWLVDYWAWNVARLVATPIFDLTVAEDRQEVARLYGHSRRWSTVEFNL